ncbi:MAG: YbfB/YjiJ family MFS transporter [Roseibium sp.]
MPATDRAPVALALGGLFSLAAAMGIGRFVYTPILPFMTDGLGMSAGDAGLIASANFLGYLMGALAGASSFLAGSPRAWFLGGLAVSALTSAAMAMTDVLSAFVVIRFVSGMASAFVLVFSTTLVLERLTEAGRGSLSSVHFAGVGCGIAFSALLIAGLGQMSLDWKTMWLASGAATAVFLLVAAVLVPAKEASSITASTMAPDANGSSFVINGDLIRLILAYGLFGFGYVITATFVSTIARSTADLAPVEQYVWLAVGISAAPSIYIWNRIASAIGLRRAFAVACLLESAGVALTAVTINQVFFLAGAALLGGTFMGITALGLMEARRLASPAGPAAIRKMLAILTASFGLGQVAGPWIAGQLHAMTGSFQTASLAAAGALVVSALLVVR